MIILVNMGLFAPFFIMKTSKYRNTKIHAYGLKFDSKKEFERYNQLKLLKKAGEIIDFKFQVPYKYDIGDKWIFTYKADFLVYHKDGTETVEDVKAYDKRTGKYLTTPLFNLKKKIIEEHFGFKIKLI